VSRYTNCILTVIAGCLVVLVWQNAFPTRSAWAGEPQDAPAVQRVVIAGIELDEKKSPASPIHVVLAPVTQPVPVSLQSLAEWKVGDFVEQDVATTNARNQSIKANALRVVVR
jgi:hypothetical protein